MSQDDKTPRSNGSILRGNYSVKSDNDPNLAAKSVEKNDQLRRTEEFEQAARERIGGSIAFVTKLKDKDKDPLFWDGEDN
ncbi:MAG: hypothetical protein VW802_01605 [Rhodospirillaceae bacterium]|jgi:hypothetical protein